jgi:hypothetical protein
MTPRHRSHGRHSNPGAGRRCRSRTLDKESIRSAGIWWVTLGISVFTMTTAAAPALALVRQKVCQRDLPTVRLFRQVRLWSCPWNLFSITLRDLA